MPDGRSDAVFMHPATGSHPGVLVWPDGLGLRPAIRDIGRRIAAEGYAVLVPNPFYRSARAPVFDTSAFKFENQADMARLQQMIAPLNAPGAAERDAAAYIAFLDAQRQVNTTKKVGTQGYCMGGPLSFRTAAAVPNRIGAVGSFHGGGLTTKAPDSPHLLIPKTNASYLVAVAQNDDAKEPDSKDILKAAFAAAKRPATVEVYPANHGWCVKGGQVYDEAAAEKAWAALTALYKTSLV